LKVGGKRESIAKLMVCPVAWSKVITNKFEVKLEEVVGRSCTVTCCQVVWTPESEAVVDAKC
jgi:hypothetical protein